MANVANSYLSDRDIRNLAAKEKKYRKVVGNPKELYIVVHPKGLKRFAVRIRENGKDVFISLKEFREGIYSVNEARRDALKKLKDLEKAGGNLEILKSGNSKYLFKNLFELYIEQMQRKGLSESYIIKVKKMCENYLLPSLANKDVKDIKRSDLVAILSAIFKPQTPSASRLDTVHRLINYLYNIFDTAYKDRYLGFNVAYGLKDEFPSLAKFYTTHGIDGRFPALTEQENLREFIKDLKSDNRLELQTKRALYLQILSVNRPINTASAKWEHIDFDKKIWTIPANEMKMRIQHEIPLTERMVKILQEQRLFSGDLSEFIFPSGNKDGHLHRDTLSKAIRNLGGSDKWRGKATTHGFRATFRTFCSLNKAKLRELDLSAEEAIESALSHLEQNKVKRTYEREKATLEQKRVLLQWYEDFLNSIEDLGI